MDYLYNHCQSGRSTAELRLELQRIMHNNAGVYRNQTLLSEGCSKLSDLSKSIPADLKVVMKMIIVLRFFLFLAF